MNKFLFAAILCVASSSALAAGSCRYEDAKVKAFVKEAVADFCDVAGEGGGVHGMFYDTKAPCVAETPIHLEGVGKKVEVSFGNRARVETLNCPSTPE